MTHDDDCSNSRHLIATSEHTFWNKGYDVYKLSSMSQLLALLLFTTRETTLSPMTLTIAHHCLLDILTEIHDISCTLLAIAPFLLKPTSVRSPLKQNLIFLARTDPLLGKMCLDHVLWNCGCSLYCNIEISGRGRCHPYFFLWCRGACPHCQLLK